ncbi:MAG: hypothetical protein ACI4KM_10325 [Oscillospiraceae bacterium]
MEWDYFVYSRGEDRTDGYALRIGPDYLPLKACIAFLDKSLIDSDNSFWSEKANNPFEIYPNARKDSFVYINVEKAKSCILMRTVEILSPDGEQMYDFQGRALWSLEGVCCPYEQRYEFFAALPSLILALKQDKDILHTHFQQGDVKYIIPDNLVFNAYADLPLPTPFYDIIEDEAEQRLFQNLTNLIYCSDEPYSFTYGELASGYLALVGGMYKIDTAFSVFDNSDKEPADNFFNSYAPIAVERTEQPRRVELVLECGIQAGKEKESFVWRIRNVSDSDAPYELYSAPESFSAENGKRMSDLLAKAAAAQSFAKQMLWELDNKNAYRYYKEG